MPVYEYLCPSGHAYEKIEGFDAPTEQACQRCGGSARRRLSVPAVIFKGSGFYSTDNRRGYASGANGGSSDGESGEQEHSHGSESKAATATEE